ncbi:MAG: serine/threonine protein kinase [Oculatellaceae cyanobacterium Prado106]|jgi:serine/threonine-protein kinase|nr:serine/threonine protein kinase [Oculatellaceae cyanobacterium Prado106]
MDICCTRPGCPRPLNHFADLDDNQTLKTTQQKFCITCGMPLLLLGRYLPVKLLGKGGFGAAFLARDRYTPAMRQCVVKQFQPSGDLSPDQLQLAQSLFEREGQVLEELGQHPQIPDLLAFFELDVPSSLPGKPDRFFYLVQEFIDGQDMEQELAQKGKFSEAEILELLQEILKVLKFVHESGSIHRDIKPSNIMRRRDGRFYLLDFGAVKQVATTSPAGGGRASTGIYSMGYAPPEQMQGNVVYPATDLYALAVTCITLVTGKDPSELYDAYSNRWNWRAYGQVSDRLEAVLNRMLEATPSQRFQSSDEVLAALKPSASPSPSPSPHPSPSPAPARAAAQPKAKRAAAASPAAPSRPTPATPAAKPQKVQAQVGTPSPAPTPAVSPARYRRPFSTLEILTGAAFTGFEGGLLAIALASIFGTAVNPSFWLVLLGVVGAIVFAQSQRWIERVDLAIISAITLAVVMFVPVLNRIVASLAVTATLPATQVILGVAVFTALVAIAVATLFRLIYNLLSRLF